MRKYDILYDMMAAKYKEENMGKEGKHWSEEMFVLSLFSFYYLQKKKDTESH